MQTKASGGKLGGMTMIEAIVVLGTLMVLAAMLLPPMTGCRCKATRTSCVNNLKQMGTAFRIWSNDNGDQNPWEVSTNAGGSKEFALTGEAFTHFQAMSNELGQFPKVLICPADTARAAAIDFAHFGDSNVSYFIGLSVTSTNDNPSLFLSGDRNLTDNGGIRRGRVTLTTRSLVNWGPGLHTVKKGAPAGNVVLADGATQQWDSPGLRFALKQPGATPNTLVFP